MRNKLTVFCILVCCSFGFSQIITEDLLLHYKFDNNTLDETSNNHHGTPNGITYTEDRHGVSNGAVYFDGINDFISLPNVMELKPELPVSFSFWVKYDSDNHQDRALFNTSFENDRSSGIYFNTQIATGKYAINYGDGSYFYQPQARRTFVSNETITTNLWHHLVVVITSETDMEIYVNCKDDGGSYSGFGGPLQYSLTAGNIGRNDRDLNVDPLYFKGAIDDFRYYNSALIQNNVDDLCTETLTLRNFNIKPTILYPNPAQTELNIINNGNQIETIFLYNALGQNLLTIPFTPKVNIEHLENGLYVVKLKGSKFVENKMILIKK